MDEKWSKYSPFNRDDPCVYIRIHISATAATPKRPPPFCKPFQGVMQLTSSPVLHRVIHCVFKQASSSDSNFWSDKLLHEILYFCALLLSEETPAEPHSLCNAAIGRFGGEWPRACVYVDHFFMKAEWRYAYTCACIFSLQN